jgi:hypothetical protein
VSLVKEEAFKRSTSKAEGNSFCTQVDFPVDLGPNRKNDLSFGYEMILAYMPPFYVKKWRSQCHFFKKIGRASRSSSGCEDPSDQRQQHQDLSLLLLGQSGVAIDPPSLICSLNGLNCTLGFMLPSVYYLIHRFPQDFDLAVLSAVNGGGNNMARAALAGALSGAMVGLKGIPERFISGLKNHERLLDLPGQVAGCGGR